jgi:hypothetical protein
MSKKRLVLKVFDKISITKEGTEWQISGPNVSDSLKVGDDISSGRARVVNHDGKNALLYIEETTNLQITDPSHDLSGILWYYLNIGCKSCFC